METIKNESIQAAVDFFNVGTVTVLGQTATGNANESYFARGKDNQEYVVRFLRGQTLEGLKNDRVIQEQLTAAEIPTAVMLTNKSGAYAYRDGGVLATISKKLPGNHPSDKTPEIARSTGVLLAKFHRAVSTLDHDSQGWLNKDRALADSNRLAANNPLTPVIRQVLHDNLKIFEADLPEGVIHGDLYKDNVLYEGETATAVLDFDESERNLLLVDIVRTICSSVGIKDGRIDPDLMKSVIEGYESIRPLTANEKEYTPMAIRYVCAAAAVWFQLHDMPGREEFFIRIAQQTKDGKGYTKTAQP